MTTEYRISRRAPDAVELELVQIWRRNLPLAGDAYAKLHWSYHEPPDRPDRVYLLEALDGDRAPEIVGSAGVVLRRFASPGGELRVALGCDLSVDESHRVVRPALGLVREVRRDACAELDLIYNFPNGRACGLYTRAGYADLGPMIRYVQLLRSAPYVVRVVRRARLARAVGALLDLAPRGRIAVADRVARRLYRLEWLDDVDDRFDALWETARTAYPIVGRRDAAWLRWRCLASPDALGRVAALMENGTLRGYAIVRVVGEVAHVRDVFGMPEHLDPLLAMLSATLRDAGVASVSLRYLGSPRIVRVLRAHGFRRRDASRHVFVTPGEALTGSARQHAADPESWHLTDYDEDT
jgi:hypothetical protein